MIEVMSLCAYLMLGDSIAVGFSRHVPYAANLAIVGNTPAGTLETLEGDLQACKGKPVVLSLGSNVLFTHQPAQERMIKEVVGAIRRDGRAVYVLPVPARGKYTTKAHSYNRFLRGLQGVKVLKDLPAGCLTRDSVHVKSRCYRSYWRKELK